jgi:predicted nucleic acid-binding protein
MRAYADSSFIVKLVASEVDSDTAIAEYRRAGKPKLFLLPLHEIEATGGILQHALHARRSLPSSERKSIARLRDLAFARMEIFKRRVFLKVDMDSDVAHQIALNLIRKHTESIGIRAMDAMHIANALVLKAELFFTTDDRQANVAKAEGLETVGIG